MKTECVQITLTELQDALRDYCKARNVEPSTVNVVSYGKAILQVPLAAGSMVRGLEFSHRSDQ